MFKNWLTSEIAQKTREETHSNTPDVLIEVGSSQLARFPAHSSILSQNSGYFRAAILRISENGKLSENSIFLPNISVEHFTPLLTYMYTGYLELTFENIFGVLLATHLLHMPRALEICREFLAQTQRSQNEVYTPNLPPPPPPPQSTVIRPIASKPPSNFGLNFVSPPKQPTNLMLSSHGTTFKSLPIESDVQKNLAISEPMKFVEKNDEKMVKKSSTQSVSKPATVSPSMKCLNVNLDGISSDKVVIDIASCDGPVRFRRVLNEAYEHNKHATSSASANADIQQQQQQQHQSSEIKYQNSISFHQQMVRNITEQYSKQKSANSGEESENSQQSIDIYTCVYCNHTFKSKYCYQKHAKRHINPLNPLGRCQRLDDNDLSDGEAKKQAHAPQQQLQQPQMSLKRDSIKPLDMNVQYYPCKYCGCKFPSYYFVHKHRKLCHPEVEADGNGNLIQNHASLSNSSLQIQQNDSSTNSNNINIDECSSEKGNDKAEENVS